MTTQTVPQSRVITSLRRRARSLRRQAFWLQQAFSNSKVQLTADVVHEILALQEESRNLDQLANRFETQYRIAA